MIPVYQTIFGNVRGNCWAANWASLLHLPIEEVPNFVEHEDYNKCIDGFTRSNGYEYLCYLINPNRTDCNADMLRDWGWPKVLPEENSINGFYDAIVFSPGFFVEERMGTEGYTPSCHAVVIDKHFNIVHDPNPAYKDVPYPMVKEWGYNGIVGVSLYKKLKP